MIVAGADSRWRRVGPIRSGCRTLRNPLIALGCLMLFATWQNVPKTVTDQDRIFIRKILDATGNQGLEYMTRDDFDEEISVIRAVQHAILDISPATSAISKGISREPRDLYLARGGICADRARSIEKMLNYLGYQTRYAALFIRAGESSLATLLKPGVPAHAVVEAWTRRGWMVVDTTSRWLSLRADGQPMSLELIDRVGTIDWSPLVGKPDPLLLRDFVFIYGLYSRHGYFYRPMTPFPDVNWYDFILYNAQRI